MKISRPAYLTLAGAFVVTAIAVSPYLRGSEQGGNGKYVTAAIDRGPIAATVTATGTMNPVTTVQVGTYVSGPILALYADYNSRVTKGQLVAKIDAASFSVKVDQAEANLTNAHARVEKD
jgi:HlyD family secretion protein